MCCKSVRSKPTTVPRVAFSGFLIRFYGLKAGKTFLSRMYLESGKAFEWTDEAAGLFKLVLFSPHQRLMQNEAR